MHTKAELLDECWCRGLCLGDTRDFLRKYGTDATITEIEEHHRARNESMRREYLEQWQRKQ